ncbi:MAG: DUF2179 domain-containing protein [Vicingaceae bacterium]
MPSFDFYAWIGLPLIIMVCRIADVTLGTMRIILITKGYRKVAPIAGFFEVLIWLFVMTQVIKHMDNLACYFGWAAGFATGVFVGSWLENKIALGIVIIRMIIPDAGEDLIAGLRAGGFSVTYVDGTGSKGPVKVLYTVTQRKLQNSAVKIIRDYNPSVLYTIEDLKSAHQDFLGNQASGSMIRVGKWK